MQLQKSNKIDSSSDNTVLIVIGVGIVIFSLLIFFVGPELVGQRLQTWNITKTEPNGHIADQGQIGDLFGGTLGPLIAWLAAILTFLAFWIQYKANQDQRKQFDQTFIDTSRERFESRFFSMVEIHRQNAQQINLGIKAEGRKAFESLYLELKMVYWMVHGLYHNNPEEISPDVLVSNDLLFEIAYLFFFFGNSDASVDMIANLVGDTFVPLVENVRDHFISVLHPDIIIDEANEQTENQEGDIGEDQDDFEEDETRSDVDSTLILHDTIGEAENIIASTDNGDLVWTNNYQFLAGHLTNLSHYIRHLFQCVKFVDDQSSAVLSKKDKYDYVSNLRAQLSVYEQALVYYNALSVLGEPWLKTKSGNEESLLAKYCMIKSLPIGLADFYKHPLDDNVLPEKNSLDKSTFEWSEIERRLQKRLEVSGDLVLDDEIQ